MNGIRPEDVTPEFIKERRAILYRQPGFRIEFPSNYGGHNTTGLRVLTPLQLEEMAEQAERFYTRG